MKKIKTTVQILSLLIVFVMVLPVELGAQNTNYPINLSPLYAVPYYALPMGSVKARGWLLTQLQLQRDGLTGEQEAIFPEVGTSNQWLGGSGDNWERGPYYVRGLVALAYTLNDSGLKTKAQTWMDWVLTHQASNGVIGPSSLDPNDWWPRMPMIVALMDYFEATADSRVLPVLQKYFNYQRQNKPSNLGYWGAARAQDNAYVVIQVYNRLNDSNLLADIDVLRSLNVNWIGAFNGGTFDAGHVVNVSQGLKEGPVYYQRSGSTTDRDSYTNGFNNLMSKHGRVDYGFNGDEFLSGKASTRSMELCAIAETIVSNSFGFRAIGSAQIGDRTEKLAFNALPGALSKTIRQHQYYVSANQVQCKYGSLGYGENYQGGQCPAWQSGDPACCCHNFHQAWPKFTQYSWMATDDNGLAIFTYAPTEVTAKVGSGTAVTIIEDTNYPFEEQVRLTVNPGAQVAFPLRIRIPEWCTNASISVNGVDQSGTKSPKTFFVVNRTWSSGDSVVINLPMPLKASTWVNNSVAVERGPLVFSLKIGENWSLRDAKTVNGKDFGRYEVLPTTSWNYGLIIDRNNPGSYLTVNTAAMPANPFIQSTTPITITARGQKISSWTLSSTTVLANEVPTSPVTSTATIDAITLVPFGAENIRITYFPQINPTTPTGTKGDVNNSGTIDIVDALAIDQYYVGLNPANFNSSLADANCSGGVDIVDALLVAQRYVGLISSFPC